MPFTLTMNSIAKFKTVLLTLSLSCHAVALLQYTFDLNNRDLYTTHFGQFLFLVALSGFLTLIIAFRQGMVFKAVLLTVKFGLFFLIITPLGDYIGIRLFLISSLLIDIGAFIPFPQNGIVSLGVILLTFLLQGPVNAWGETLPSLAVHDLFSLAAFALLVMIITDLLSYIVKKHKSQLDIAKRLDEAVMQLTSANVGFQNYMKVVEEQSVLSERNRITRELHDTVGYTLTNLIMMMEAACRYGRGECSELMKILEQAKAHAQDGLKEIRSTLSFLRSLELSKVTGTKAIYKLIKAFESATKIRINVDFCNIQWSFSDEINLFIYRFIQEGMTNAFRHGKAGRIEIRFWQSSEVLKIFIQDNGSGCPVVEDGIGLIGMRERLKHIRGRLIAKNNLDGFLLIAEIPYKVSPVIQE